MKTAKKGSEREVEFNLIHKRWSGRRVAIGEETLLSVGAAVASLVGLAL